MCSVPESVWAHVLSHIDLTPLRSSRPSEDNPLSPRGEEFDKKSSDRHGAAQDPDGTACRRGRYLTRFLPSPAVARRSSGHGLSQAVQHAAFRPPCVLRHVSHLNRYRLYSRGAAGHPAAPTSAPLTLNARACTLQSAFKSKSATGEARDQSWTVGCRARVGDGDETARALFARRRGAVAPAECRRPDATSWVYRQPAAADIRTRLQSPRAVRYGLDGGQSGVIVVYVIDDGGRRSKASGQLAEWQSAPMCGLGCRHSQLPWRLRFG